MAVTGKAKSDSDGYIPFILKWKILLSYERTMAIVIVHWISMVACYWFLGTIHDHIRNPFTYIWFFYWIAAIWIFRWVVKGLYDLFEIPSLDGLIEELFNNETYVDKIRRKLWKKERSREPKYRSRFRLQMNSLFIKENNDEFEKYLDKLIFRKAEQVVFLILFIIQIILIFGVRQLDPNWSDQYYQISQYPWEFFHWFSVTLFYNFMWYPTLSLVTILTNFSWAIYLLRPIKQNDTSKISNPEIQLSISKTLKISNFVHSLKTRGNSVEATNMMEYELYHSRIILIGQYLYSLTFYIIILVTPWTITVAIFLSDNASTFLIFSYISGFMILSSVCLFFLQIGIHKALKASKEAVLEGYNEMYNETVIEGIQQSAKRVGIRVDKSRHTTIEIDIPNHTSSINSDLEIQTSIRERLEKQSTWGFKPSMFLKVITASLIPLVYMLASLALEQVWQLIIR